jgi:hypothetical protein
MTGSQKYTLGLGDKRIIPGDSFLFSFTSSAKLLNTENRVTSLSGQGRISCPVVASTVRLASDVKKGIKRSYVGGEYMFVILTLKA